MQQPRIWLVEDEQSIADTLVYMLQQEGFQVSVFGRGLPALEAAAISWFGQPLNLTRYEFLLLKTLLHAPGRVFSRQQLMELVWIDAWESLDRTVDTHIKTLRAKLRAVNPEKAPINTHRGMGYSLGRG